MKILRSLTVLLFAFILTAAATEAQAEPLSPVEIAVKNNSRLRTIQRSLAGQGYSLEDVKEGPNMFLLPPAAPYLWGYVTYIYTNTSAGTLAADKVELRVQVRVTDNGFVFPEVTISESENN